MLDLEEQYVVAEMAIQEVDSLTQIARDNGVSRRTVGRIRDKYNNLDPFLKELSDSLGMLVDWKTEISVMEDEYPFTKNGKGVLREITNIYNYHFSRNVIPDWDEMRNAEFVGAAFKVLNEASKKDEEPDEVDEVWAETGFEDFDDEDDPDIEYEDCWLNETGLEEFYKEDDPVIEYKATITTSSISVTRMSENDVDQVVIGRENPQFFEAWKIVRDMNDPDDQMALALIHELGNVQNYVKRITQGALEIDGESGVVSYQGFNISDKMCQRIIDEVFGCEQDSDLQHRIVNFFERVMENPSPRSVECLYDFMQNADIRINEDGSIRAYKKININYRDCRSDSIDNSVGTEPSMPRHLVDPDPSVACAPGLHVCSKGYLGFYPGEITVECEVDPKDVVAVPYDHSCQKMRVCKYKVVGVL